MNQLESSTATNKVQQDKKINKRKRGLKPRSKRNRKRARGGVGILNHFEQEKDEEDDATKEEYHVQIDIVPLEIKDYDKKININNRQKRIRVVQPYPFTYATFAKARWTNRSILDVYDAEFGSYPRTYYEMAIQNGRITVSGKKVDCNYIIKGGDELSHVVHRHEPAVAICDGNKLGGGEEETSVDDTNYVTVIHEDEDIIVIDKPSTVPVHPCGGYNFNSLFHILSHQNPSLKGKLHNIHRLDRLTSGLTIVAKNTEMAKALGKCINDRDECYKVYLARVKGCFPLNAPMDKRYPVQKEDNANESSSANYSLPRILNGEWDIDDKGENYKKGEAATTFWITNNKGEAHASLLLNDVFQSRIDVTKLTHDGFSSSSTKEETENICWFNLACPCEITCHKNGICKAGNGKAAQTSFTVVHYDKETDSTVVLAKPLTGRTHQIRLHLQFLGHPIANDPNYGGDMFYANEEGLKMCQIAQEKMKQIDDSLILSDDKDGSPSKITTVVSRPLNAISTDIPATEEEVKKANEHERNESETFLDYLKRTCVWCARSRGEEDRTVLEFLSRSQGIWLHALSYSLKGPDEQRMSYSTPIPHWSCF